MGINALTARRLAGQRRKQQIMEVTQKNVNIPVCWVLCWGKIDYRTGIWEWKNEHSFENRSAAVANKNSFLRYPVADQNACYIVRRYHHGNQNTTETVEGIH